MKKLSLLSFALVLVSSCAGFPHGAAVRPVDLYGTVTLIDPVEHRIDLELDTATRYTVQAEETSLGPDHGRGSDRSVQLYYDDSSTVWNGVRADQIRTGDRIVVNGRVDKGHWRAYAISSRTN
jgi:hypothetical protein